MKADIDLRPLPALLPDELGFFEGGYGGRYVPEILRPNLVELEEAFLKAIKDASFWSEYLEELIQFSGRPSAITPLKNLSKKLGGGLIVLKREDLNQTGAHKVNNVIGQGLLTKRLGKTRVIAETGAGQHGVATATMAARFGLRATIYMGAEDVERQRPNVFWMEKMGAEVVAVESGTRTLKDAINEALRDWSSNFSSTHYLLGTACGPHPFPALVMYLQSIIGAEAKQQIKNLYGRLPHSVYACVGGGSNAVGIMRAFLDDKKVKLVGVEAGGKGLKPGEHASRIAQSNARVGIAQGYKTLFLQNEDGQMLDTHSVSAGLDYVGISPILASWYEQGRLKVDRASDDKAVQAVRLLMEHEGIISALESAHGLAGAIAAAPDCKPNDILLVNMSGRGDKDIFTVADALGDESWQEFLAYKAEKGRE